jgi:DNA-binding CsgD family transcriptional regulator
MLIPSGLRAARFTLGDDPFVVLSFPLQVPDLPQSLTTAEREIALALLEGRTNAEIAASRGTSHRTVANQVSAILFKAGVPSRSQLVASLGRARRH